MNGFPTLGTEVGPGTSAFELAGEAISALPALAAAAALLAVMMAVGSYLISQKGDPDRYAFVRRVLRVLMAVSFMACLGALVAWVFANGADGYMSAPLYAVRQGLGF